MNRLGTDYRSPVLVLGDGPMGILMAWLLVRLQSAVSLVGGRPGRLRVARETGIEEVEDFHTFSGGQGEGILARFGHRFPTVVEASGSGDGMQAAMDVLEHGGRILLVSSPGVDRAHFLWTQILWNEIEIRASNASAGGWAAAVRFAANRDVPLERLVTHRFGVDSFEGAFSLLRDTLSPAIKVVLDWQGESGV